MLPYILRYLQKLGGKYIKQFTKRWFVYDDASGRLEFFKAKGDKLPLGCGRSGLL